MAIIKLAYVDRFQDTVMSVQEIECTDDGGAIEIAESLLTDGCGIEVWDVGRRVC